MIDYSIILDICSLFAANVEERVELYAWLFHYSCIKSSYLVDTSVRPVRKE